MQRGLWNSRASVHPLVSRSVPLSDGSSGGWWVCCWVPGGLGGSLRSIDSRCVSHRTVLSSKCGQCQVNSQGTRLKIQTRLSIVPRLRCGQSARLVLVHLSQWQTCPRVENNAANNALLLFNSYMHIFNFFFVRFSLQNMHQYRLEYCRLVSVVLPANAFAKYANKKCTITNTCSCLLKLYCIGNAMTSVTYYVVFNTQ